MNLKLLYSDIDPGMNMAWDKDVQVSTGARAVKNSLLGIVLTRKGSRPFMPTFGCDMMDSLFENLTPLAADTIQKNVFTAIRNWEPRITDLNVEVQALYDDNSVIVTIRFAILDNPDTLEELKMRLRSGN
ncbi:baseplate wedge subunit protein [Serratia phage Muldoon]|uniref:Baseplate wedge subunit protein n=1 Tax=Serratia phage Muldoon TaxID=2601678 RepID=A0A5P8PHL5_9CAUD|nr:baseplate wedge subunit [Serratia phage Muldoon]QFR56145.1 baseplate wedge subunit protein [Serratia phage Muldoon]